MSTIIAETVKNFDVSFPASGGFWFWCFSGAFVCVAQKCGSGTGSVPPREIGGGGKGPVFLCFRPYGSMCVWNTLAPSFIQQLHFTVRDGQLRQEKPYHSHFCTSSVYRVIAYQYAMKTINLQCAKQTWRSSSSRSVRYLISLNSFVVQKSEISHLADLLWFFSSV